MMRMLLATLTLFALAAPASAQTLHKWVDKDGRVHYTDTPPPADARQKQEKKVTGNVIGTDLPFPLREASRRFPVTLYVTDCGELCSNARNYLTKRGIPYIERDAARTEEQEQLRKLIGSLEVPVLVVGSQTYRGFEEPRWQAALDEAGYPREPLLPSQRARVQPVKPPKPAARAQAPAAAESAAEAPAPESEAAPGEQPPPAAQ